MQPPSPQRLKPNAHRRIETKRNEMKRNEIDVVHFVSFRAHASSSMCIAVSRCARRFASVRARFAMDLISEHVRNFVQLLATT